MSSPSTQKMRRLKGRLVKGPTDLTLAYPYGGTELGMIRTATFIFGVRYSPVLAEEFGGNTVDYIFNTESAVFSAVLRDFDDDMITSIFNTSTKGKDEDGAHNTVTGNPVVRGELLGTLKPGQSGFSRTMKLLFVPDDRENHEFLVMYEAMPMVQESSEMRMTAADWAEIGVVFHAIPDSSGRLYQFGRKLDITI